MGIDIIARWPSQTPKEREAQQTVWLSTIDGRFGYLREDCHGAPYATQHLFQEVFEDGNAAKIPAAILRERLPRTLALVEELERSIYRSDEKYIEQVKQSYRDFVDLCEAKEREHGDPVLIAASF